ncbi:MAG: transketolase family protein [Fusobacteria bacterium]|nr:transketolase family protein [Fusobacteriota bacterium]
MEEKATRIAYGETLASLGETNPNIVVLDADLSGSTKTSVFAKKFPERFINVGIAEQDLMGTAAGIASTGKIVFVSTFAMFAAGRAYEQIRNTIAYSKFNVKICPSHAGISVGEDGASHQAIEDIALMRVIPEMKVLCPADAIETKKMLEKAIEYNGPVYIRLARLATPIIFDENYNFEIGKISTLREGNDVTIAAMGMLVGEAIEASKILEKEGIKARVLNVSTIKPLDKETILKAAKETKFIVTAEEHSVIGGLGSAISEFLSEEYPTNVYKIGIYDRFGESGTGKELLEKFGLKAKDIVAKVKEKL